MKINEIVYEINKVANPLLSIVTRYGFDIHFGLKMVQGVLHFRKMELDFSLINCRRLPHPK